MTQKKSEDLLDSLSGDEARLVLRKLCGPDATTRKRVLAEARKVLGRVDPEDIAGQVLLDLELIDLDDVHDRAGPGRYGYLSPDEAAWQAFEETLEPHSERMDRYRKLGMVEQANRCLMGILKGVYLFDEEADTEFKKAEPDVAAETAAGILGEWWKQAGKSDRRQMEAFVSSECPEWAAWTSRFRVGST